MAMFPEWGYYAPGIAPILAISVAYVVIGVVGHGLMRVISGPATADPLANTIIGHGRRLRHAHDDQRECVWVRRGICEPCGKTFTILPELRLCGFDILVDVECNADRRVTTCAWKPWKSKRF